MHLVSLWDPVVQVAAAEESTAYTNASKKAVYHFLVACKDLGMRECDLFSISELYKDDTDVFIKALGVVTAFVEILKRAGKFPPNKELPFTMLNNTLNNATDTRSKIVQVNNLQMKYLLKELLDTERKYIASLEEIKAYSRKLDSLNIISKDAQATLFSNLDHLVDFQRRFLIAMETTLSLPPNEQRIGLLFSQNEQYFAVYEAFCANVNNATMCVVEETTVLSVCHVSSCLIDKKLSHLIEPRNLQSFFIKPVQRLCRYPLLLAELIKHTKPDSYAYLDELTLGFEASKRIADRINEQARQEENKTIKLELIQRVDEWKGLVSENFGDLLLDGRFPLAASDSEREYHLFLFQSILLCCKESSSKKKKRKGKEDLSLYTIKGNIFISSINGVSEVMKVGSGFELKVFWVNRSDVESFALKCISLEQLTLWKDRIEKLLFQKRHSHLAQVRLSQQQGLNFSDDSDFEKSRTNSTQPSFRKSIPLSRTASYDSDFDTAFQRMTAGGPPIPLRQSSGSERNLNDRPQSTDTFRSGLEVKRKSSREFLTSVNNSPQMSKTRLDASPRSYTEIVHPIQSISGAPRPTSSNSSSSHYEKMLLPVREPGSQRRDSAESRLLAQLNKLKSNTSQNSSIDMSADAQVIKSRSTSKLPPPSSALPPPPFNSPPNPRISPTPQPHNFIPIVKTTSASIQQTPNYVRIKVHHNADIFMVAAPTLSTNYIDLYHKIEKKIKLCTGMEEDEVLERFKMQYVDEGGDLVMIVCDDDLVLGFEGYQRSERVMVVHITSG